MQTDVYGKRYRTMRNGEATKLNIKNAALDLFVKQGVDGTGVREIAKAAGITEGAMYRHFAGKDALVWALFADNYQAYGQKLDALQAGALGTGAKIDAMVQGFCAFFDDDETLFQFLLLVQHGQLAKVPDDMRTPVQVVEDVVQAGIDAGEVGYKDATAATACVFGIVLQTATFKIYGRLGGTLKSRAIDLATACRNAIGLE